MVTLKANNESASFCIDNGYSHAFLKMRKDPLDSFSITTNKILHDLSLYYIKQTDSIMPFICLGIDHRRFQTVVRTSDTYSAIALFATFLVLTTL